MTNDHSVTWTVEEEGVTKAKLVCNAERGAGCKVFCSESMCEESIIEPWLVGDEWVHTASVYTPAEDHDVESEVQHTLMHGECNYQNWMADEGVAFHYAGPEHSIVDGPIDITWEGDYYVWEYVDQDERLTEVEGHARQVYAGKAPQPLGIGVADA